MVLKITDHGQLSSSSILWAKPPIDVTMSFTFFNITNSQQVQYYTAKPNVTEKGPFSFRMTETKKDLKFSKDGNTVHYKSYKQYFYEPNMSCPSCRNNPELILPNVAALGAITTMIEEKECGPTCRLIIDIGLLLMGEYPFRKLRPLNVTFYGYNDPLLSLTNSPIFKYFGDKFNDGKSIIPLKIPHLQNLALFYKLNNSNDEDYIIETGKNDINSIGVIQNWAGSNHLPLSWWQTKQARMINGTDAGSFAPLHLTPSTILPFFSSFLCRSFAAEFSKHSTYKKMRSVEFTVPQDEFDTISNKRIGFRYRNLEKIRYFPEWNPCSKMTRNNNFTSCSNISINCLLEQNLCHHCCKGNYVDGTYLLPPGMFPLVCFPGKNETLPMSAIISPPYFSYSPKEVINSVIGFPQLNVKPSTFTFTREPLTGLLLQINIQLMVSFPMFQTNESTIATRLPNLMTPMMLIRVHGELSDDFFNMLFTNLILIPKYVGWIRITFITSGICILIAYGIFTLVRYFQKVK
ncbi:unnamed protein product [Wuchereria bancrofti]|uniref:CD36 family protein n=1 Tax=Wuchereria bancrofti TaxID=6293 RepID=A0A3P7GHI8_WUCBA|nr:unnamed protein product [Wuchereria bancrofti]